MKQLSLLTLTLSLLGINSFLKSFPAISQTESPENIITFKCEGSGSFSGQFSATEAVVNLPEQGQVTLPLVVSASGAKYSNETITVWTKGNQAFVEVNNQIILDNCSTLAENITNNNVNQLSTSKLADTKWRLVSWGEQQTPLRNTEITLEFTNNRLSGSGSCNRYHGGYTVDNNNLNITPIASTRKACSQKIMNQESNYFTHLQATKSYEINAQGQLKIAYQTDKHSGVMIFEPK